MAQSRRIAGVLGGMGPDATVDFMARVIALTPAVRDQDHVRMLVDHNPQVPNRQAAILADGEDPGPELARMAARLEAAGAEFLVMPCNSAHVFEDHVVKATSIPLVSIIDASVGAVSSVAPGVRSVGLLATDGCIRAGIFQRGLRSAGLVPVLPDAAELGRAMDLIGRIKAGDRRDAVAAGMRGLAGALVDRGAGALIAGCTEIPLVLGPDELDVPLIESTNELAKKTVGIALGEISLPGT